MTPYYEDAWVRLFNCDCRELLPTLPAGSADAVVTDPPYGLGFAYSGYEDTRDNLTALIHGFVPEAQRVAKRLIVLPGITQVHLYPPPDWTACVVWDTTGSFGSYGFTQWMPVLCYGEDVSGFARLGNGVLKSDVLRISGGGGVGFMRRATKKHPCPKPANLMRQIVLRFTEDTATILDPFAGSGTTLVAAKEMGRKAVGIEIHEPYCEIAANRLAQNVLEYGDRA